VKASDRIQDDVEMVVSSILHRRNSDATRETEDDFLPIIGTKDDDTIPITDTQEVSDVYIDYEASYNSYTEYDDKDVYVGYEVAYDSYNVDRTRENNVTNNPMHRSINYTKSQAADEVEDASSTVAKPNYMINRDHLYSNETEEDGLNFRRRAFKDGNHNLLYRFYYFAFSNYWCNKTGTRDSFIEVYRKFEEQQILAGMSASSARVNQFHAALNSSKNSSKNVLQNRMSSKKS